MSYFLFLGPVRLIMYVLHGGYASARKRLEGKQGRCMSALGCPFVYFNERISGCGSCRERLKNRDGEIGKGEERK